MDVPPLSPICVEVMEATLAELNSFDAAARARGEEPMSLIVPWIKAQDPVIAGFIVAMIKGLDDCGGLHIGPRLMFDDVTVTRLIIKTAFVIYRLQQRQAVRDQEDADAALAAELQGPTEEPADEPPRADSGPADPGPGPL